MRKPRSKKFNALGDIEYNAEITECGVATIKERWGWTPLENLTVSSAKDARAYAKWLLRYAEWRDTQDKNPCKKCDNKRCDYVGTGARGRGYLTDAEYTNLCEKIEKENEEEMKEINRKNE